MVIGQEDGKGRDQTHCNLLEQAGTQLMIGINEKYNATSWARDLMRAKECTPLTFQGEHTSRFTAAADANHRYTPLPGSHKTHDLGMAMDLGINDYIDSFYQSAVGQERTRSIEIPGTIPFGRDNDGAIKLADLLLREVGGSLSTNNQRDAILDFLSLYWVTQNDLMRLDGQGQPSDEWVIVNGGTDEERRAIQSALFRGAGELSLISEVLIGEQGYNTYPEIRKVLSRLDIDNRPAAPHRHHFHIYLKPPAPYDPATEDLVVRAVEHEWETRFAESQLLAGAVVESSTIRLHADYDKIVNFCMYARTYASDSFYPTEVAKAAYGHDFETTEKIGVVAYEVVRLPRHGSLELVTTYIKDGKEFSLDGPTYRMKSSDGYIGPDLAEYRVVLENGKTVLVRSQIYWVNMDTDSFWGCPPTSEEWEMMRDFQKRIRQGVLGLGPILFR